MLNEDLLDEKQDFTKEDLIESHDIGGDVTNIESDSEEENITEQKVCNIRPIQNWRKIRKTNRGKNYYEDIKIIKALEARGARFSKK